MVIRERLRNAGVACTPTPRTVVYASINPRVPIREQRCPEAIDAARTLSARWHTPSPLDKLPRTVTQPPQSTNQLMEQAVAHHQAGRLRDAAPIYQAVLSR